jgi:hypothetical protein
MSNRLPGRGLPPDGVVSTPTDHSLTLEST